MIAAEPFCLKLGCVSSLCLPSVSIGLSEIRGRPKSRTLYLPKVVYLLCQSSSLLKNTIGWGKVSSLHVVINVVINVVRKHRPVV